MDAQALVDVADLIVIAVPDDAIVPVAGAITWQARHQSSTVAEQRKFPHWPCAERRCGDRRLPPTAKFHRYRNRAAHPAGCTIGIEAQEPLLGTLTGMALALGCHPIRIPAGARPLYHASGHFVAPFLVTLLNEALGFWSTFGLGREEALRALLPLMHGTLAPIEVNGPTRSLSGPIARADVGTIVRHLEALRGGPRALPLYVIWHGTLPIAEAKGGASQDKLEALRALHQAAPPVNTDLAVVLPSRPISKGL